MQSLQRVFLKSVSILPQQAFRVILAWSQIRHLLFRSPVVALSRGNHIQPEGPRLSRLSKNYTSMAEFPRVGKVIDIVLTCSGRDILLELESLLSHKTTSNSLANVFFDVVEVVSALADDKIKVASSALLRKGEARLFFLQNCVVRAKVGRPWLILDLPHLDLIVQKS